MDSFNVSRYLIGLADKLDKKAIKGKHAVENIDYLKREVPKVPLVGGLLYIWESFKLARKVNEISNKEMLRSMNVSRAVRDSQLRKSRILEQLDEIYSTGVSRKITISKENETILNDLCKDYNGLTALKTGDCKYTIVVKREDDLVC